MFWQMFLACFPSIHTYTQELKDYFRAIYRAPTEEDLDTFFVGWECNMSGVAAKSSSSSSPFFSLHGRALHMCCVTLGLLVASLLPTYEPTVLHG
jgi:hypothetical protein